MGPSGRSRPEPPAARSAPICGFPDRAGIRVRRKGAKEQVIPLNDDARTALERWLEMRPDMPTPAVFFRVPFQPFPDRLDYVSVEKILKRYAGLAGVPLKYGQLFQVLLPTVAQHLANLGVPLRNIRVRSATRTHRRR